MGKRYRETPARGSLSKKTISAKHLGASFPFVHTFVPQMHVQTACQGVPPGPQYLGSVPNPLILKI